MSEQSLASVVALVGKSRISVAHDAHAQAVERVTALGAELRTAFDAVWRAEEQLLAVGVTATASFPHPIDEAWASWRAKQILRQDEPVRRHRH